MVFLEGVRIPKDRVLGEEGQGFKIALSTLDTGRVSLAAGAVGLMQRALDLSLRYAKERHQFGRPIASFQLVQAHLAQMKLDLEASRLLTYQAVAKKLKGERYTLEASMAKLFASEAANRVAYRAIQVHGGLRLLRGVRGGPALSGCPHPHPLRGNQRGADPGDRGPPHRDQSFWRRLGR